VLGIILVALTSVSATTSLLVPTYATTTTTDVRDTTTGFSDIVNGTMIPSEEDIGNITGAIQNIQIVFSESTPTTIPPGSYGDASADCPSGGTLTGGGFFSIVENLRVYRSFPLDENTWQVRAINENPSGGGGGDLIAWALCLVASTQ
jgi:hypothetical protein